MSRCFLCHRELSAEAQRERDATNALFEPGIKYPLEYIIPGNMLASPVGSLLAKSWSDQDGDFLAFNGATQVVETHNLSEGLGYGGHSMPEGSAGR